MTHPFTPEPIAARIARYESGRQYALGQANAAETREEKSYWLGQAALAGALLAGLEEAAAMLGVKLPQR